LLTAIQDYIARHPLLLKEAKGIALPKFWYDLQGNGQVIWGIYRTSQRTYETFVDLRFEQLGFRCNCQSRRNPCKHGIALLVLMLEFGDSFLITSAFPAELTDWLNRRTSRLTPKERSDEEEHELQAAREKNWEKRLQQMAKGLEELELWLHDVIREGTATYLEKPNDYWSEWSAQLTNAKMGNLAKKVKGLQHLSGKENANEQMLMALGEIYLLVQGFFHIRELNDGFQQELLQQIGVNIKKQTLLEQEGTKDTWRVLGIHEGMEEKLVYRRTWLFGQQTQQYALLIDFAWGNEPFEYNWMVNETVEATLVYYPTQYAQRALMKEFIQISEQIAWLGYTNVQSALEDYAKALAANPWLSVFPILFQEVVPIMRESQLYLVDAYKTMIPCWVETTTVAWQIVAMSANAPIEVFGEWDGHRLAPLGAISANSYLDCSIYYQRSASVPY
jgi:hypothetical protein